MALFYNNEKLPNFKFNEIGDVYQITLTQDSTEFHVKEFVDGRPTDHLYWSPEGGRPVKLKEIPNNLQAMARPLMGATVQGVDANGVEYRHNLTDRQLKAAQEAYKAAVKAHPDHKFKSCFEQGGEFAARYAESVPGKGPIPRKVIEFVYMPPTEG